jgi:hypothetical protein
LGISVPARPVEGYLAAQDKLGLLMTLCFLLVEVSLQLLYVLGGPAVVGVRGVHLFGEPLVVVGVAVRLLLLQLGWQWLLQMANFVECVSPLELLPRVAGFGRVWLRRPLLLLLLLLLLHK